MDIEEIQSDRAVDLLTQNKQLHIDAEQLEIRLKESRKLSSGHKDRELANAKKCSEYYEQIKQLQTKIEQQQTRPSVFRQKVTCALLDSRSTEEQCKVALELLHEGENIIERQQDCIRELLPITRRFIEICELYKEKNPDVEVAIAKAEELIK